MTISASCDRFVAEHALQQAHAPIHVLLPEAALGHRRRIVLAHQADTFVQRLLAHLQHLDRDPGVGEVHRDAAAHGAGTDHGGRLDFARRGVLGNIRYLGHLAFGEKQVAQRLGLGACAQALEQLALARDAFRKRLRRCGLEAIHDGERRGVAAMLLGDARPGGGEERVGGLLQFRGEAAGAADLAAFTHHPVGELRAGDRDVALHDLVDQPEVQRLLGRNRLAACDQVERALHPDQTRQALRAVGAGEQAQLHLRQAELRSGNRAAKMTGKRQLQPAAQREAVDRRDDRLGHGVEVPGEHRQRREPHRRWLAKLRDVRAAGEGPPAAQEQEGPDRRVVFALLDRVQDSLQHTFADAERVHRRVVQGDHAQVALDGISHDFTHVLNSK